MTALAGRKLRIKYDGDAVGSGPAIVIAKARAESGSITLEPINITSKDDGPNRTLQNDVGAQSMDATIEGVLPVGDTTLIDLVNNAGEGTALHFFEIEIQGLGTYRGQFFINNFELAGAEGTDPVTFTCGLMSSGAFPFTAAA